MVTKYKLLLNRGGHQSGVECSSCSVCLHEKLENVE